MNIPYGMSTFIGLPGSGKTSLLTYCVRKFISDRDNLNRMCLTNVPIIGASKFEMSDLGNYLIQDGFLGIDEMGINQYNRNWKSNLNRELLEFAKTYRHYDISHYMLFSQAMDFDNLWINLSESLHLMRKIGPYTVIFHYHRVFFGFDPQTGRPIFGWGPDKMNKLSLIFRPPTYPYFDSYERKELPVKEFPAWTSLSRFRNMEYVNMTRLEKIQQNIVDGMNNYIIERSRYARHDDEVYDVLLQKELIDKSIQNGFFEF